MSSLSGQLRAFARHLRQRQADILTEWRRAVAADPGLKTPTSLSRTRFNDHVPEILEAFAAGLESADFVNHADADPQHAGERHGAHRWQQGYVLPEVAAEWKHLQLVLLDEAECYAAGQPDLLAQTLPHVRRAVVILCTEGVEHSIAEYVRLQQAGAASRVRELELALAELQQVQRQRSDVWRQAAHDLRDNVGLVSTATVVLNHPAVDETMRAQSLSTLEKGLSSLRAMLNDLLSLARLEAGQERRRLAPFDAAEMLRTLCQNALPLAAGRGLYLRADGPPLQVEGDAVKVQRIVQNLLMNALKYTREGGVTITWGVREDHAIRQWFVRVTDTGPGVDLSAHTQIFQELQAITEDAPRESGKPDLAQERAAQASARQVPASEAAAPPTSALPSSAGEGLGLSIVKQLCELLDATLELDSKAGEGTSVRVLLPISYARD